MPNSNHRTLGSIRSQNKIYEHAQIPSLIVRMMIIGAEEGTMTLESGRGMGGS